MGWHETYAYVTRTIPQGTMFMAKHVVHTDRRSNVDKALSQMVRIGLICRLHPGVFYRRYYAYDDLPTPADIARFRIEAAGEAVTIHGADAAASFGLHVAPSTRPRFYTSARTRTVRIGDHEVRFDRVPAVYLAFPGTRAGEALAALHVLGAVPRTDDVARIVAGLDGQDRARLREVLMRLPDRVASAWFSAEPGTQPVLPEPLRPAGPRKAPIARRELLRRWREENRRMALRWPRIRRAPPMLADRRRLDEG